MISESVNFFARIRSINEAPLFHVSKIYIISNQNSIGLAHFFMLKMFLPFFIFNLILKIENVQTQDFQMILRELQTVAVADDYLFDGKVEFKIYSFIYVTRNPFRLLSFVKLKTSTDWSPYYFAFMWWPLFGIVSFFI